MHILSAVVGGAGTAVAPKSLFFPALSVGAHLIDSRLPGKSPFSAFLLPATYETGCVTGESRRTTTIKRARQRQKSITWN